MAFLSLSRSGLVKSHDTSISFDGKMTSLQPWNHAILFPLDAFCILPSLAPGGQQHGFALVAKRGLNFLQVLIRLDVSCIRFAGAAFRGAPNLLQIEHPNHPNPVVRRFFHS